MRGDILIERLKLRDLAKVRNLKEKKLIYEADVTCCGLAGRQAVCGPGCKYYLATCCHDKSIPQTGGAATVNRSLRARAPVSEASCSKRLPELRQSLGIIAVLSYVIGLVQIRLIDRDISTRLAYRNGR